MCREHGRREGELLVISLLHPHTTKPHYKVTIWVWPDGLSHASAGFIFGSGSQCLCLSLSLCVCMCVDVRVIFYHARFGDWTQVIRVGNKGLCLYPLNSLTGSTLVVFLFLFFFFSMSLLLVCGLPN